MPVFKAKTKLFIAGVLRLPGEEFEYDGPPRPASHMVPVEKPSSKLGPPAPSPVRPRLAPAHPDLPVSPPKTPATHADLSDPRDADPKVDTSFVDDLLT